MHNQLFSRIILAALLMLAGTQPLPAQAPNNATPPAQGDVLLDLSRIYVLVGKTGFGHEHGVMGELQAGQVNLGAKQNAGKLVFDMTKFDADSPAARKYVGLAGETDDGTRKQVNDNMLGKDVLNVKKFPTATLTIDSALPMKPVAGSKNPRYELQGSFTLHGVTKTITLPCDVSAYENNVRLTTSFTVLQTDFGIKPFSKAFGAVGVTNELQIFGDLIIASGR